MKTLFPTLAVGALLCACKNDVDTSASGGGSSHASTTKTTTTASSSGSGGSDAAACADDDGQCIFRHDTFGDEQLWTDALRLNELVQMLSPTAALGVGLKVDASAVPAEVLASADLNDPATTVALLGLDAVVGVRAKVNGGTIERIGITCALCHSTVDDAVMPGVGARLDGFPNRDLDPGLIISLTPGLADYAASKGLDAALVKTVYESWGPGFYDARFNQDGESAPVLIPPAYGLADVALESYTGEGPISYWNAYVAVTQMGAQGNFVDPDIGVSIMHTPDRVTAKLPALAAYQRSLAAPAPPGGSFDAVAAGRGAVTFAARCASCHAGPAFSDAPTMHDAASIGQDPTEANRSKSGAYRTTPLRGAWQRAPYFHDGSAATLEDVVVHYETVFGFTLNVADRDDLVQYLLSL
jgi:mono/diheme cytochrome c family protein